MEGAIMRPDPVGETPINKQRPRFITEVFKFYGLLRDWRPSQ